MCTAVIPFRRVEDPKRPTPKPKAYPFPKAMTIAIGILCEDGIVLAADRQMTVQGFRKFSKQKISKHSSNWIDLGYVFSGSMGIAEEFKQKLFPSLDPKEMVQDQSSAGYVREKVEEVLRQMKEQPRPPDAQLLFFIAVNEGHWGQYLLMYDGQSLIEADPGTYFIGCGDTSLTAYLSHQFGPIKHLERASAVAAFLVKKATLYLEGCDEPIDVLEMADLGTEQMSPDNVEKLITEMESLEVKAFQTFKP